MSPTDAPSIADALSQEVGDNKVPEAFGGYGETVRDLTVRYGHSGAATH